MNIVKTCQSWPNWAYADIGLDNTMRTMEELETGLEQVLPEGTEFELEEYDNGGAGILIKFYGIEELKEMLRSIRNHYPDAVINSVTYDKYFLDIRTYNTEYDCGYAYEETCFFDNEKEAIDIIKSFLKERGRNIAPLKHIGTLPEYLDAVKERFDDMPETVEYYVYEDIGDVS